MAEADTKTVLVTGGSGYIAGETIRQLLANGWAVHTTVRSLSREATLRPQLGGTPETLRFFAADLMDDAGWAEAVKGCSHVAHVASPFPLGIPKDENELIVPAREGTLRALRFAKAAGVTRFVQTSSAAAIAYGHPAGKTLFDESDWTRLETPGVAPYVKSKTIAERAARDWVAANAPDMVFCSVNPVAVFGPVVSDDLSTSVEVVRKLINGSIPMLPDMGIGVVDVRDVAKMHVLALEASDETVQGERFAASAQFMWVKDMADTLRDGLGSQARKVPTRMMPEFVARLLALFMPEMKIVRAEGGKVRDVSGRHACDVLGFEYITAQQSVIDTARSLIGQGIVKV
ncbi:MAG: NAD-dependent epimerase/dehydratase family protein [Novosphingobium sp.]|nr:NAD-dependent epimerase/dehydratase family protein [Novosphingobium sp.]